MKMPLGKRVRLIAQRLALLLVTLISVYAAFLATGFIPLGGSPPPAADDQVRIFVRSNSIHTDFVLPTVEPSTGVDWRQLFPPSDFVVPPGDAEYVAFGWGNRQFYTETPTWAEFKVSTACCALFYPSETVLHVEYLDYAQPGSDVREVLISGDQYERLVKFVESSVGELDDDGSATIASPFTYGRADRFYVASGRYHLFNTCNQWTGRGLKRAGVRTGIWTPLKPQVLLWLPKYEATSPGVSSRE